jgi:hypothetical protein
VQGVKRKVGEAAGANAPGGDVTVGMWHHLFGDDLKISGWCCRFSCMGVLYHGQAMWSRHFFG